MFALLSRIDLMVRLLIAAILLATFLPVTGAQRDAAQMVSSIAIFLLFFLNGVRLSRRQVIAGLANWQMLLPLTIWCFAAMALAGWGLFAIGDFYLPPLVALGLLYLGVLPSTVQSATAYTSLAEGNVASSVIAAALLNILGIFITAPIFAWLSGGESVQLGLGGLTKIFMILLLPFALGQIFQSRLAPFLMQRPTIISWLDKLAIAIAVYVAFSGAVEQGIWHQLSPLAWAVLIILLTVMLVFAFGGSWLVSRAIGLTRGDRISFMFAGAHKSVAMGAPLALVLFPAAEAGLILVPLLLYHLFQLIVSAPLATRLAAPRRPH